LSSTPISNVSGHFGTSSKAPTPRKELVILITVGWALVLFFTITVLAAAIPLQVRSLEWSQNLSRLIVDAGSLSLVGLSLVRYASYIRTLDLPSSQAIAERVRASGSRSQNRGASNEDSEVDAEEMIAGSLPVDQLVKDKVAMERNKLWIRRVAIAGSLGMLLLAPLQVVNFMRGAQTLDKQFTSAVVTERQRFGEFEQALQDLPAERLRLEWLEFKRGQANQNQASPPSPTAQLEELTKEAEKNRDITLQNLQRQVNNARFLLGRDTLRVLLGCLIYGWAYWAFFRKA
jgi:hypothetical protein